MLENHTHHFPETLIKYLPGKVSSFWKEIWPSDPQVNMVTVSETKRGMQIREKQNGALG